MQSEGQKGVQAVNRIVPAEESVVLRAFQSRFKQVDLKKIVKERARRNLQIEAELNAFVRPIALANKNKKSLENHDVIHNTNVSNNLYDMGARNLDEFSDSLVRFTKAVDLVRLSSPERRQKVSPDGVAAAVNLLLSKEGKPLSEGHDFLSRSDVYAVFNLTAQILGRNSEEAVLADARATVKRMFATDSSIVPFETKRGRGAVSAVDWIRQFVRPKLDPDMRRVAEDLSVYSWMNPRVGKGVRTSLYQALMNHHTKSKLKSLSLK